MREVQVVAKAPGLTPAEVYAKLADFAGYADYSPAVRSVVVTHSDDGRSFSDWEVSFREGILRWKEEDILLPDDHTLRFIQVEGDIDYFAGAWSVTATDDGSMVCFDCTFDMGIPGLNDILEPIAAQALHDNAMSIIAGLRPPVSYGAVDGAEGGEALCNS